MTMHSICGINYELLLMVTTEMLKSFIQNFILCFLIMFFQQNLMIKVYNKYTILAEVANEVLAHLSGSNTIAIEPEKILLSIPEIEIKNLQYLAGFVVHKLYTNFQRIQLVFFINNVVQF